MENNGQERFEIPDLLGPYRIRRELARGGMGVVYVAEDTRLEREIVIKVLPETLLDDEERQASFEREAKLLASLNHPNIATIHSFEQIEGVRFITLELIPGASLDKHIQKGALSVERTLAIGLQITRGLEAAHMRGVVHRDLKPSNVQVTPDSIRKYCLDHLKTALPTERQSVPKLAPLFAAGDTLPEELRLLWNVEVVRGAVLPEDVLDVISQLEQDVSEFLLKNPPHLDPIP